MNIIAPLLAKVDVGDVIQFIVVLLIFIIPAIGQLLAKVKKMQPPPGGGAGKPRPPRQAPADVLDEIGEFLRRAVDQRKGGPAEQQPKPPAAAKQPSPATKPAQAQAAAAKKISTPPPEKQPRPVGGQVAEHVKQRLDAEEFSRRTGQLGAEVAQTDRQIDQHLHQVFDHNLSQIAATPGETSQAPTAAAPSELAETIEIPSTFAAGLAAMLSSGESVLQAVALSEIIHRPEERWA